MTKKTLKFGRGPKDLRPFEVAALNAVPGLGYYYPDLSTLRVEAQMLLPGDVSVDTVSVFFKLVSFDGRENIEIQNPLLPGVYANQGFIWASSDGTANATILDEVVNGHKAIESQIDGVPVRFEFDPEYGGYFPVEEPTRDFAIKLALKRRVTKAA